MERCAVQCFDLDSLEDAGGKSPTVRGRGIKSGKDVEVQGAAACAQGEDDAEGWLMQGVRPAELKCLIKRNRHYLNTSGVLA